MQEYLATFHTHAGAIKFESALKKRGITCELLPTPRKLSSSCGVSARFSGEFRDSICDDLDKVYAIEGNEYRLVFENE